MKPPRPGSTLNAMVPCAMPLDDMTPCGGPGEAWLPAGICGVHALAVFRVVASKVDDYAREASRAS